MEGNELEHVFAFADAEIGIHPDFIALRLRRWEVPAGQDPKLVPGLWHQLRRPHLEDLIAHLQQALLDLDGGKTKATTPPGEPLH